MEGLLFIERVQPALVAASISPGNLFIFIFDINPLVSLDVDFILHHFHLRNYISLFTEPCSFNSLICEVVNPNSPDHSCLDASLAVTVRVALCPLPEGSFLAFPSKTSSSDLPANLSQFELLFQLVHSLIVTTSPSFIPIH
ncbi:hypothetical protein DTO013E5_7390 [Penicillium roqueforti]|uniref:uncharacterized protein n=1 Tax=Penicillium roqueforti TaxID=5082 RepID=UPI00190D5550|nr:uncharacterized protein LCP9604111_5115 [Penicillium roqueforti]KAF9248876.1 hypothetical protein LCP9604111_5115 [Penicillium roqueforti]KAI1831754.1 hypothetical protein CBS147337_7564 [Penicillium roqueforti]KAI2681567.1 hypothetical protein CBS147355_2777 [Penicillium roqueforti]KAI2688955.1 hypothetical protein LCP963914a_2044 [Penicillium roqueforti]KAI2703986.1 hypothetical protein CBS147372_2455 [Penicillium roqueforti]